MERGAPFRCPDIPSKPTADAVQATNDFAPLGVVAGGGSNEIRPAIVIEHLTKIDHRPSLVQSHGDGPGTNAEFSTGQDEPSVVREEIG
jgi:hypothetical protein